MQMSQAFTLNGPGISISPDGRSFLLSDILAQESKMELNQDGISLNCTHVEKKSVFLNKMGHIY